MGWVIWIGIVDYGRGYHPAKSVDSPLKRHSILPKWSPLWRPTWPWRFGSALLEPQLGWTWMRGNPSSAHVNLCTVGCIHVRCNYCCNNVQSSVAALLSWLDTKSRKQNGKTSWIRNERDNSSVVQILPCMTILPDIQEDDVPGWCPVSACAKWLTRHARRSTVYGSLQFWPLFPRPMVFGAGLHLPMG